MAGLFTNTAIGPLVTSSGASSIVITQADSAVGNLHVNVIGFEGISAAPPYVSSISGGGGWWPMFEQGPSGSGSGISVWAVFYGSGSAPTFSFALSAPIAARQASFSFAAPKGIGPGGLNELCAGINSGGSNNVLARSAANTVVGSAPKTPLLTTYVGESIFIAGADILNAPGWGTPANTPSGAWPIANVFDNVRSGASSVRIYLNWQNTTVQGAAQGSWTAAVAPAGTTRGATGITAFRPPDRRIPGVFLRAATSAGLL